MSAAANFSDPARHNSVAPSTTTPNKRKSLGRHYEQLANEYLHLHGYLVIARNYYARHKEIDLIAVAPYQLLIFIEVKYRRLGPEQAPSTLFMASQQKRMMQATEQYLSEHPELQAYFIRYDLILFTPIAERCAAAQQPQIALKHFKQIFTHNEPVYL